MLTFELNPFSIFVLLSKILHGLPQVGYAIKNSRKQLSFWMCAHF